MIRLEIDETSKEKCKFWEKKFCFATRTTFSFHEFHESLMPKWKICCYTFHLSQFAKQIILLTFLSPPSENMLALERKHMMKT